jgi:hypothetical protein
LTTAKKTTRSSKKAPSKKSARSGSSTGARAQARPDPTPVRVAGQAADQLLVLTGRESEGVTGMERTEDGWAVQIEVLELRRVPTTTDVLGLYEVHTDRRGELQSYRRLRRYTRGASDDE